MIILDRSGKVCAWTEIVKGYDGQYRWFVQYYQYQWQTQSFWI